ncbi:isochorismatase family protein [Streptomyces sp. NPDC021020]|uniref:isochorismatase family protein n=1 Tax=Streptomyces sp. NPDC021020 TaxID=3365109 RepID=UPI0037922C63
MPGLPAFEDYPLPRAADLPVGPAAWKAEPDRAVLLVHDMQRYFLRPFPEPLRSRLVENVATVRGRAAASGVPVGYTAQPGDMDDGERGLLKDFWGPGMRATAADRRIVDAVAPAPGDWAFTKRRYSAFYRSDLLERIRESKRDQLVLCGVYAHVGVLATAIEAFSHDLQTFVVADAVADFTADYHQLALHYAAERCAVVVTAAEVFP